MRWRTERLTRLRAWWKTSVIRYELRDGSKGAELLSAAYFAAWGIASLLYPYGEIFTDWSIVFRVGYPAISLLFLGFAAIQIWLRFQAPTLAITGARRTCAVFAGLILWWRAASLIEVADAVISFLPTALFLIVFGALLFYAAGRNRTAL